MKVIFTKRHCGYFEGADPDLDESEAKRLIDLGVCKRAPAEKPEHDDKATTTTAKK